MVRRAVASSASASASAPGGRASKRGKIAHHDVWEEMGLGPAGPAGPATIEEMFNWPEVIAQTLTSCPDRRARLLDSLDRGIVLGSSYSGMRTEELAAAALVIGVHRAVPGYAPTNEPFMFHSTTDIARECQKLAMEASPSRRPKHVFQDLRHRLRVSCQEHLDRLNTCFTDQNLGMASAEKTKKCLLRPMRR